MAGLSTIIGGISTVGGIASSFSGGSGGSKNNTQLQMLSLLLDSQANGVRQLQMNLDATRRKRDVVRQAQVASATSEAAAVNAGAGNSSVAAGAQSSIVSEADTNLTGISKNQELSNQLFSINNQKMMFGIQQAKEEGQMAASQKTRASFRSMFSNLSGIAEPFSKLAKFGSSSFSSWTPQWDFSV